MEHQSQSIIRLDNLESAKNLLLSSVQSFISRSDLENVEFIHSMHLQGKL